MLSSSGPPSPLPLLPRLDLWRHDSYLVEAGSLGCVNRLSDVSVVNVFVTFDEHHLLRAGLKYIFQSSLQLGPLHRLAVDLHTVILRHLNHHCGILIGGGRGLIGRWWLRH